MPRVYHRLRIRTADDTADALILSTRAGVGVACLAGPPTGDGTEIDPWTGRVTVGSYSGEAIDEETGGGTRVVTAALEDAGGRAQLIGRRTVWERQEDDGAWTVTLPGYLTGLTLTGALRWTIQTGDSRRIELRSRAFAPRVLGVDVNGQPITEPWPTFLARWPRRGAIFGGPVLSPDGQPWLFARDLGGWTARIVGKVVRQPYGRDSWACEMLGGYLAPGFAPTADLGALVRDVRRRTARYYVGRATRLYDDPSGEVEVPYEGGYPDLVVRVTDSDGVRSWRDPGQYDGDASGLWGVGGLMLDVLDTADPLTSGETLRVAAITRAVTPASPIYVHAHPADLVAALWDEAGIAYDPASIAAVRTLVGAGERFAARITEPQPLAEFLERSLFGPCGLSVRPDGAGWALIGARVTGRPTPTVTLGDGDLVAPGTPWQQDDQGIVTRVVLEQTRYVPQPQNATTEEQASDLPGDGVATQPERVERVTGDDTLAGARELTYRVGGMLLTDAGQPSAASRATLLAREVWDRASRGPRVAEVRVRLDSPVAAVPLGDEVVVAIGHLPNRNRRLRDAARAGSPVPGRVMQVVRRTPGAADVALRLLDSGTLAQLLTVPALTVAVRPQARLTVQATLGNRAALVADGAGLRLRLARTDTNVAPAEDAGADVVTLPAGALPETAIPLPPVDAGGWVWVRARAEAPDARPSAWSAWVGVQVLALAAPTALAVSNSASDGSRLTATWTPGSNASAAGARTEVWLNRATASPDVALLVADLPAGSTRWTTTGLVPSTAYVVSVRHRAPSGEVSAWVTASRTTSTAVLTLPTPTRWAPTATLEGRYGIGVVVPSSALPCDVEIRRATETGVNTGAWGTESTVAVVAAVAGGWTVWTEQAPADGRDRRLRARLTRVGADPSAYTPHVVADPYSAQPIQLDLVPLALTVRPVAQTATTLSVVADASDPLDALVPTVALTRADGVPGGLGAITGAGTPASPWVVPRPPQGSAQARLTATATAPNRLPATDGVDVQPQTPAPQTPPSTITITDATVAPADGTVTLTLAATLAPGDARMVVSWVGYAAGHSTSFPLAATWTHVAAFGPLAEIPGPESIDYTVTLTTAGGTVLAVSNTVRVTSVAPL